MFPYFAATLAAFCATFLRGLQNLNMSTGNRKLATITGYCMNVLEVATVAYVANQGIHIVFVSALGAAAGYNVSMRCHKWLTRKSRKLKKAQEKQKFLSAVREVIEDERRERKLRKGDA